jgi:hypothetical protein
MKRAILFVCLMILASSTLSQAKDNVCVDEGLTGKKLRICRQLCVRLDCDSAEQIYTTENCVEKFDRYFRVSGGEMPPCLPSYDEGYLKNEIYCYSNWKVGVKEECESQFDPAVDEKDVVDETNGVSQYEICLMNKMAQFDVCLMGMDMQVYSGCYNSYSTPEEVDACYQEIVDQFYFVGGE